MLEFAATPARVREATKLAYRMNLPMFEGVQDYWANLPRVSEIPGFAFKLLPYQADGVAHLEKWDGSALIGDEPGLGKTAQVMAYAFKNDRFPMLAVLPKTLLLNWRKEITLMMGAQKSVLIVGIVPGKKRQAVLKKIHPHVTYSKVPLQGFDITLINYELLHRNLDSLERMRYTYVAVDESHKIKNPKALRTRALLRMVSGREEVKRGEWRVLHEGVRSITFMTGTPLVSRPVELWTTIQTIAEWVPQFNSFFKFALQFCAAHQTKFGWNFSGASNLLELNKLLTDTIMIRRRKDQVLKDLPEKIYSHVPLEFDRKDYDQVEAAFAHGLDWKAGFASLIKHGGQAPKSDAAIVAINKLREIAAYSKIESAAEWITDFVEQGDKLVVFAHYRNVIQQLKEKIEHCADYDGRVVVIQGGVSPEERDAAVEAFQNDPQVRVILISHSAGGFGITLTAAHSVAFVELPWSPSEIQQCADRVHRIGQKNCVNVYVLMAEGTVEEDIAGMIMVKATVVDQAVDGGAVPNGVKV